MQTQPQDPFSQQHERFATQFHALSNAVQPVKIRRGDDRARCKRSMNEDLARQKSTKNRSVLRVREDSEEVFNEGKASSGAFADAPYLLEYFMHQQFVRHALGYRGLAQDFLSKFLPFSTVALLQMDELQPVPTHAVNGRLQERGLEGAWSVPVKEKSETVLVGVHFMSSGIKSAPFTLLHRLLDLTQRHRPSQPPFVYGILLYNGKYGHLPIGSGLDHTLKKLEDNSALRMQRLTWVDVHTRLMHESDSLMLQAFQGCLRFPYCDNGGWLWERLCPVLQKLVQSPHAHEVVFGNACLRYMLRMRPEQSTAPVVKALLAM